MTVEESLRLVPKLPGAKTKNLFLRDKKGRRHFLVTVRARQRRSIIDALAAAIGVNGLGFASAERLQKYLGITPGSVSLLALVNDEARAVEFVIDRALWEAEAVHAHPLVNTATMVVPHADLERFLAATGHVPRVIDVPGETALSRDGRTLRSAASCRDDAPILRLDDVHKAFGATEVLRGISMSAAKGDAVCIIGPSGSGKSTLLRCINGLIPVDRGEIHVGPHAVHRLKSDKEMIALRKDVSIVFQQYNLFPHKTALQNIMMAPIDVLGQPRDEVEARAHELLKKVRLARQGVELSGRALRRAAAARGDRAGARDAAVGDAVRRSDGGARPGDAQRSAGDDTPAGRGGDDVGAGHARDGLRARDRRPRLFHRSRRHRRGRAAGESCSSAPQKERTRAFLEQVL